MNDDLIERLRECCTDYNGQPMRDGAMPEFTLDCREMREAADRLEALEARLEVVPGWSEDADGIACRNDTIALQDKRLEALTAEVVRLREALGTAACCLQQCADGSATLNDMDEWSEDARAALKDTSPEQQGE